MSLFSSSSSSRSNGGSSTGADAPVEGGFIDFARLINSLGTRNPKDYFGGASRLQNAAYSMAGGMANRWGANFGQVNGSGGGAGSPQPIHMGDGLYGVTPGNDLTIRGSGGATGGQSLYGAAGITNPEGTVDYESYVTSNPAIMNAWRNLTPRDRNNISQVIGDGSGGLSIEQFGRYHFDNEGSGGFNVPRFGGGGEPGSPSPFNQNFAEYGYSDANEPYNPVADWQHASNVARNLAYSGPNLAGIADLGPANTYDATGYRASGPASATGYSAGGPAAARTYDAAGQAASQGINVAGQAGSEGYTASPLAQTQGYDSAQAGSQGYDAVRAGSRGYGASTIGDDQRVDLGSASRGSARRGIEFSEDYENRYIDNVVDTTLANFDEYAGRQRAAEAAQAAGNNAFGGSRFAVQRAITEEQIARERQAAEAGLRFDAQDKAFGFGIQDAQRFTDTSLANAQMANQRAEAQARMDMDRLIANMNATNRASEFGAAADNAASSQFASETNQARAFGADSANRAALDNAARSDQAAAFAADASNRAALDFAARGDAASAFGADASNRAALDFAGRSDAGAMFGADAANRAALDAASRQDAAAALGAEADNRSALDFAARDDASAAFGADALNRSALDFASRDDAGRAFTAGALNDAGQFNANAQNQFDLSEFAASNDMARFNAGQADTADTRRLNAANSLSNIANTASSNQRADLEMINALGVDQRNIEQQQRTADLELMRIMAQMYGSMPWFTDQRFNESTSSSSTPSAASIAGSLAMAGSGLPFGSIQSALGFGGGNITGPIIQDSVNGAFYT